MQSDFSRDSIRNTCLEHGQNSLTSATTALGTRVWNTVTTSHAVWLQQQQHREHKSGTQSHHHMQSDFSNDSTGNTSLEHSHNITCSLTSATTASGTHSHNMSVLHASKHTSVLCKLGHEKHNQNTSHAVWFQQWHWQHQKHTSGTHTLTV